MDRRIADHPDQAEGPDGGQDVRQPHDDSDKDRIGQQPEFNRQGDLGVHDGFLVLKGRQQTSNKPAAPWPPPMHMVVTT